MTNRIQPRMVRTGYLLIIVGLLALAGALWRAYIARAPERRNQAMVRAVGAGNLALVRQYLAEGADPNTVFRYLDEPAESQGFSPKALWIRVRGGPGAPSMRDGPTALMRAVEGNNPQMVQLLLAHGADMNKPGWYGDTALSEAEERRLPAIIRMLKRAGARQ